MLDREGWAAFALTPLNALRYAPDITVTLGGTTVTPQNVAEDNLLGAVTLVPIGTIPNGTDVLAYYQLAGGDQLLAFGTDVSLAGGITARTGDVVRYDGTNYTIYFDATAHGLPVGVMTDAVSLIGGTDPAGNFQITVAPALSCGERLHQTTGAAGRDRAYCLSRRPPP